MDYESDEFVVVDTEDDTELGLGCLVLYVFLLG